MKFFVYEIDELKILVNNCTYKELIQFAKYINDVAPGNINMKGINSLRKTMLVSYLVEHLSKDENLLKITQKIYSTEISSYLYSNIVWQGVTFQTAEIEAKFKTHFQKESSSRYGENETSLVGVLSFINRVTYQSGGYYYTDKNTDILRMDSNIRALFKIVLPVPNDFDLVPEVDIKETMHTYSNENEIFGFIDIISDMLKNNLVEFGKTNEKPLAKSLNILKNSSAINEFYSEKKMDNLATDMLTRSFSYYYWMSEKFKSSEVESLKEFVHKKFEDKYHFFIMRILASHLKKVRFDYYNGRELGLFSALKIIIDDLPKESWVDIEKVLKYSRYRNLRFDLEYKSRTDDYYLEGELNNYYCGESYEALFFEPVLKGAFFYLAALGLFEIKYDRPKSNYSVAAKDKSYISVWDKLKYIKITELGKYVFGFIDKYEQKSITKMTTSLKFDEYNTIITVDEKDTIMQAKLEPFTEKYDKGRYILSYAKIFKDCKSRKILDIKIDNFYKNIEKNPPQVFKDFFEQIKKDSNMLKRDLSQIVIELKDNKKLLNLFLKNKKLQDLIIKAEGYRVIVNKKDIPKLTKIVKDNGFFIEF